MSKEAYEILIQEIKRLNRLNEVYEKNILKEKYDNEPELIIKNVLAMCEIATLI